MSELQTLSSTTGPPSGGPVTQPSEGGTVTIPLASLVEDMAIYPRHAIDGQHVGSIVEAIKAGNTLPPLVVEAGSLRIVDGWHRYRAWIRILGEQGTVICLLRTYATEADLLLDAIRLNAAHGRKLDKMDQVRAIHLAEQAGASAQAISIVLNVTEGKVEQLRIRVAYSETPETPPIPLKRPANWKAGQTLTPAQEKAHQSMPGTSLLLTARQLKLAIETELLNPEDNSLRKELAALEAVLRPWVKKHPPLKGGDREE